VLSIEHSHYSHCASSRPVVPVSRFGSRYRGRGRSQVTASHSPTAAKQGRDAAPGTLSVSSLLKHSERQPGCSNSVQQLVLLSALTPWPTTALKLPTWNPKTLNIRLVTPTSRSEFLTQYAAPPSHTQRTCNARFTGVWNPVSLSLLRLWLVAGGRRSSDPEAHAIVHCHARPTFPKTISRSHSAAT
jgi:hypothetical protein